MSATLTSGKTKQDLKRILHVDDNYDMRTVAQFALDSVGGFDLHQCADAWSALQIAERFSPDLFLLDVMMPGMSGQDLRGNLNAIPALKDVPTIFLTVRAQDKFENQLLSEGALAVIPKPFDPMTLSEQVRAIWTAQQV